MNEVPMEEKGLMDIKRAIEYALSGQAILFAGAGCSIGAVNLREQPFKTGTRHLHKVNL